MSVSKPTSSWQKYLVLFTLWASWIPRQPTQVLKISGGDIRGRIHNGGVYRQYLGIPYGSTNRGNRFRAPLPEPKWEGVFDAINEHERCHQFMSDYFATGHEDCLKINVFTPLDIPEEPLPVMAYVHGGGYYEGSGTPAIYGPEYLVQKNIILVTFNYRLNVQGFLCLGIKEAPGNAGMKDQVAALRWIQKNIRTFGGNPDDVTLVGESAGAVSVSYHLISPMSKGLFHKAVMQSGSALAAWSHQQQPIYMASLLAKSLGYRTQNPKELYDIFMETSDSDLVLVRIPRKEGNIITSELIFVPCTEEKIEGVEPFLTDTPYNLFSRGEYHDVPIMMGTNSEEGVFLVSLENSTTVPKIKFEKALPKDLHFPVNETKLEVAKTFKKLYMDDSEIEMGSLDKLSGFAGEQVFTFPVVMQTLFLLQFSEKPIFNYKFVYDGYLNIMKMCTGINIGGATHADDLFYLFKPQFLPTPFRFLETSFVDRMTTLWTNFIKYGEPTPKSGPRWRPTEKASPRNYVLDKDSRYESLWESESIRFWNETYTKYRRKEWNWHITYD